jgi:hypothetical protein
VSQPYPKSSKDILVRVVNREIQGGMAGVVNDKRDYTLHELLSTFMVKLGIENAITSGIVVQLMTNGKVRVDFSSLSQRIELVRDEDLLTAPQAMALFEDFAASVKLPEDMQGKRQTTRIVVQKPRG